MIIPTQSFCRTAAIGRAARREPIMAVAREQRTRGGLSSQVDGSGSALSTDSTLFRNVAMSRIATAHLPWPFSVRRGEL